MHNSGAEKTNKCLLDEFNLRLGLSLPRAVFEEEGEIFDCFGGTIFECKKASDGKLTP